MRILRDLISEAIKTESKDLQKYARVRWGAVGANANDPISTVEAARRIGLTIAEAVEYEARIHDLLPLIFPAVMSAALAPPAESAVVAAFEITPQLIISAEAVSTQLIRELLKYPDLLKQIHHRRFEEIVAFFFSEVGYEVELTKRTRDGGRDVIAVRHGEVDVRYLIECKHPTSGAPIGIGPVRELYAVKVDEGATKALLATTSYFTRDAQVFAERHRWELQLNDYDAVMHWLQLVARRDGA